MGLTGFAHMMTNYLNTRRLLDDTFVCFQFGSVSKAGEMARYGTVRFFPKMKCSQNYRKNTFLG